ncbi:MAG: DUF3037 domain-containing protein [Bryobacteraceae bacterium]
MHGTQSYDYAVLRVAPSVEREEFLNAGVVLHCPERAYLDCRVRVDHVRLLLLWPDLDIDLVQRHLDAFRKVCAGDPEAGPIGQLSRRERFQWLVAPRSTMIQISPVHSGMCESPADTLDEIFRRLVLL